MRASISGATADAFLTKNLQHPFANCAFGSAILSPPAQMGKTEEIEIGVTGFELTSARMNHDNNGWK